MPSELLLQTLQRGMQAQQNGRIAEAEQCFRAALMQDPRNPETNYLLGALLVQRQQFADGEKLLALASMGAPNHPMPYFQRGVALVRLQRLPEAVASFDRAIALKSDYVEAYESRGVTLGMMGRRQEAVASFDRAIKLRPDYPGVYVNRGIALLGMDRGADAIASFDRAIKLNTRLPEPLFLRARAHQLVGQNKEALADFTQVLSLAPAHVPAMVGRAHALLLLGRAAEGLPLCENAIAQAPQLVEAWLTRGNIFLELERHKEAIADYDRVLALNPGVADALVNRGNAYFALRQLHPALADYDSAIAAKPDHDKAHLNRASALVQLDRLNEAVDAYDRAITLKPGQAESFHKRGSALLLLGRAEESLKNLRQAWALDPGISLLQTAISRASMQLCDWSNFSSDRDALLARAAEGGDKVEGPFALLFVSDDPALQLCCAQRYAAKMFPVVSPPLWQGAVYRHERIRLAYLSDSFRRHVTTTLTGGLFAQHDRTRFETIALSLAADDGSAERRALEPAFDRFLDVSGKSDQDVAELIRSLEIDVLVDLDGFIEGSRSGILARRPAPVQVNYLGYPGTMGTAYMDYILADAVLIGAGDERYYTEKVAWLPGSYQPNTSRSAIAAPPSRMALGLPETGFVFCSFNNNHKITPEIFDVWMRILQQVPGSVLWLLAMNQTARANLVAEAAARGVAADRLVFADVVTDQAEHLGRQQAADLFLDSWPCNAHTTASDALWARLPLLTCKGASFAGRVAASALTAAGLPELVTNSLAEYEDLALRLAWDPALLKSLRDRLAQGRDTCALFDGARIIRNLEAAYEQMAGMARRGEVPRSFDVAQD